MEITDLRIRPGRVQQGTTTIIAKCEIVFDSALIVNLRICEGKKGIYVVWQGVAFTTADARKEASNRALATYVINYCLNDHSK